MYSEAIAFLDHNTEQYMIEDMTNQLHALKKEKMEWDAERQDLETENKRLAEELARLKELYETTTNPQ